jgi:hypothetical protein
MKIRLQKGESLRQYLTDIDVHIKCGIWVLEEGSLQKRAISKDDSYTVLNLYAVDDYFIGDSDLFIDYVALEYSVIRSVGISDIDPVKVLFQLDDLEQLNWLNSFKLQEKNQSNNRIDLFVNWASRKLHKSVMEVPKVLSQDVISKLTGVNRVTVNRKITVRRTSTAKNTQDMIG